MPSGPPLFDDEDGVDADHESPPRASHDSDDPSATSPATRRGPNYLFRRAVVVGGVVAVLATASIVVGQLIGSGSTDTTSGAISTDWNRIVLVDSRTGRVIVDDQRAGAGLAVGHQSSQRRGSAKMMRKMLPPPGRGS